MPHSIPFVSSICLLAEFGRSKRSGVCLRVRVLLVSSCWQRARGLCSPSSFRCLSYLNLDNNDLSGAGIVSLRDLPHLSVLRLNNNRITTLMPTEGSDAVFGGMTAALVLLLLPSLSSTSSTNRWLLCTTRGSAAWVQSHHGHRVAGFGAYPRVEGAVLARQRHSAHRWFAYVHLTSRAGVGQEQDKIHRLVIVSWPYRPTRAAPASACMVCKCVA